MRGKWIVLTVAAVILLGLSGCATVIKPVSAQDLNAKVKTGALVEKANNFEVIMDTSASMDDSYQWSHYAYTEKMKTTKVEYEQHLVRLFNDTIPNLKLTSGLRDFAGRRWLSRPYDTKLWYGMAPYVKGGFGKAVYEVNTGGVESPLDLALDAATADLKPLAGKSAVVIFSDGLEMPKAVASAQAMKATLKDRVCIYAVLIGNDVVTADAPQGEGRVLLDKVVQAGQCGYLVKGEQVSTAAGMADFVEKIFLGPPPPAVKKPVVVSPVAAPVPAKDYKLEAIYFDFDKYRITPEGREALKRNAKWLQKHPGKNVVIEGNSDERGTNEYNKVLGQKRADSAAKALRALGVEAKRIKAVSYGKEKPVCKEPNEACRSKNRRAVFVVK